VALVLSNTRSDRVKAVRRLAGRSAREREQRFVVEGPQAVRAALAAGRVRELYVTEAGASRATGLLDAARAAGADPRPVTPEVLAVMAGDDGTVAPQGVLAVCGTVGVPLAEALAGRPALVPVLVAVQDPGNAGTIIRTADAAGAGAVVVTAGSVDVHNPKCVRSTAGSLFHLPVVTGVPLAGVVTALHAAGARVLAAAGGGGRDLDDVLDAGELDGPTAWLFGNEANGLPAEALELADDVVRIPIHGRAESLNVATAAAVCLYASARAQRPRPVD
jgi:TrmH family RNA methyltransferase